MESVMIIDSSRLPIGKYGGALSQFLPEQLGGYLLNKMINNINVNLHDIDELIVGNIIGGGGNIARRIGLTSGLPLEIPAFTIDRQCASGLESVITATAKIKSGMAQCIICGGVESSSRAPWLIERPQQLFGRAPKILERAPLSVEPYGDPSMGEACELLAKKYDISRHDQDHYAFNSQLKYQSALTEGRFTEEITPIDHIGQDESPRSNTTLDKLNSLPSVFSKNGTLTAGNSCPINDGASFMILASKEFCRSNNIQPIAEIIDGVSCGVEPISFGIGPVSATDKLLNKNNLTISDIHRIELNEAFAAQTLSCIKLGQWPIDKINVSGGALAFGHPFGATGAILVRRLITELHRQNNLELGLVSMCVGGGQGTSLLIRKVSHGN